MWNEVSVRLLPKPYTPRMPLPLRHCPSTAITPFCCFHSALPAPRSAHALRSLPQPCPPKMPPSLCHWPSIPLLLLPHYLTCLLHTLPTQTLPAPALPPSIPSPMPLPHHLYATALVRSPFSLACPTPCPRCPSPAPPPNPLPVPLPQHSVHHAAATPSDLPGPHSVPYSAHSKPSLPLHIPLLVPLPQHSAHHAVGSLPERYGAALLMSRHCKLFELRTCKAWGV